MEIASGLAARGVDVTVAVPGLGTVSEHLGARGVATVALPYSWAACVFRHRNEPAAVVRELEVVRRYFVELAPDVVVTNTSVIPWFGYVANLLGVPHAWFLREDVTANSEIEYYPSSSEALALIDRWSDRIFTCSEHLQARYLAAFCRSDIDVFYPWFDRRLCDFPEPPATSEETRILVLGSLQPTKNQLEALRAAAILRRERQCFVLTIMGFPTSADYTAELHRFVADNGLEGTVRFRDQCADPYPTLAAHDVCVAPAVAEPFGRVVVEAMLLGKVVVASDAGGHRETVDSAKGAGLLYPLGRPDLLAAHLRALIDAPGDRQAIGQRARRHAIARFLDHDEAARMHDTLARLAELAKPAGRNWIDTASLAVNQQLSRELESRQRELEVQRSALDRSSARIDALRAELEARGAELGELRAERERLRAEAARGHTANARQQEEMERRLAAEERFAHYLTGSVSWRLTAPLRALRRGFGGLVSKRSR